MARYSSDYEVLNTKQLDEAFLGDVGQLVEGGGVCWVIDQTFSGGITHVIRNYDSSRQGEYKYSHVPQLKPHVIFKCICDCRSNNVSIALEDGTIIYVFNGLYVGCPLYVVARLTDARAWELA